MNKIISFLGPFFILSTLFILSVQGVNNVGHLVKYDKDKMLNYTDLDFDVSARNYHATFINVSELDDRNQGGPFLLQAVPNRFRSRGSCGRSKNKLTTSDNLW